MGVGGCAPGYRAAAQPSKADPGRFVVRRLAASAAALMATEAEFKLWFPAAARGARPGAPALRVLCFHNAGSAESTYTQPYVARGKREPNELQTWAAAHNAEILAVQLPGREARRTEPTLRSCQAVAAALLPVIEPLIRDTRYVVVGHSVGTWNSYELLCLVRERGLPMPVRIFYSGFASPDIPEAERPWTAQALLPTDAAFQQECRGWDVNEVVFSAGMWGMYKDLMRADFCCFDEYQYSHAAEPPLGVPMTTFYATNDKKITPAMVQGWAKHAAKDGSFESLPIQGHHLFHYDNALKKVWFGHIVQRLDACLTAPIPAASTGPSVCATPAAAPGNVSHARYALRWALNIRTWHPSADEWQLALSLLPPEDAERVERFKFEKDKKLAMGSRLLQRAAISSLFGIQWRDVQIGRTKEGKPYLANAPLPEAVAALPNFNFNVTHHGGIVAIATEPAALVGLDVMDALERPGGSSGRSAEEFFRSFTDNFTAHEWSTIRAPGDDNGCFAQFYRHWSMKEAYIKAVGIGLGFDLKRAEFRYVPGSSDARATVSIDCKHHSGWSFVLTELMDSHVACTACGPPTEACDTYRATLPAFTRPNVPALSSASAFSGDAFDVKTFADLLKCADVQPVPSPSLLPSPEPSPAPAVAVPQTTAAAASAIAQANRVASLETKDAKVAKVSFNACMRVCP